MAGLFPDLGGFLGAQGVLFPPTEVKPNSFCQFISFLLQFTGGVFLIDLFVGDLDLVELVGLLLLVLAGGGALVQFSRVNHLQPVVAALFDLGRRRLVELPYETVL